MAAYKKSIVDLESLKTKNNNTIKNQLEQLGKLIAAIDESALKDTAILTLVSEIKAKEAELAEKERTIETWNQLSGKLDEVTNDIKLIDAEIGRKRAELEPHFESIGEAVLDAYQSSDREIGELSQLAEQIVSLQEDIREKERELHALESGDGKDSFIGKTIAAGRGLVIRGSLKSRGMQKSRALRDIGERVCGMGASALKGDSILSQVLYPVRDELGEISKLQNKRQSLEASKEKVLDGRVEIEKRERMRNPVRNLGHAVDLLRTQINELSSRIGAAFAESDLAGKVEGDGIRQSLEAVKSLRDENDRVDALIEKLEAAILVDKLSAQIDTKRTARARLEAEIAAIDASVEELKSQKTSQSKVRGALATLETAVNEILGMDTE